MKYIKDHPKQPKNWTVQVDEDGHYLSGDYWSYGAKNLDGKPLPIVEAELELDSVRRGRSSVTFHFKDVDTGKYYETAPQASLAMFKLSEKGRIKGLFTFEKQGYQVSIVPYNE